MSTQVRPLISEGNMPMKKSGLVVSVAVLAGLLVLASRVHLPDRLSAPPHSMDPSPPRPAAEPSASLPEPSASPTSGRPGGITWFTTWNSGLAEAERTGRPILLVAAAPHCAGVSGIW